MSKQKKSKKEVCDVCGKTAKKFVQCIDDKCCPSCAAEFVKSEEKINKTLKAKNKRFTNSIPTKVVKKESKKVEKKVDKFNRRIGTQGYLINTKMSKTPKSIEAIAKECKLPRGRVATHVRALTNLGFFKKDKDGKYSIK